MRGRRWLLWEGCVLRFLWFSGIPCVLRTRPLRGAKGSCAQPHLRRIRCQITCASPVAIPLWIPAFAGMTVVAHSTRKEGVNSLASLGSQRFCRGLASGVTLPERYPSGYPPTDSLHNLTYDGSTVRFCAFPVARPLWIPAFAGMTVITHSTPTRVRRGFCNGIACAGMMTVLVAYNYLK